MTYTLIFPIMAMFLLTLAVTLYMAYVRFKAIKGGHVDPRYFKVYVGDVPEKLQLASRHYTNLFELPVLFYVGILCAIILGITGTWIHFWAWFFVVARIVHAAIHLGKNKLLWRMRVFALGWVAVTAIYILVFCETMTRLG